jgi:hypothetical protein
MLELLLLSRASETHVPVLFTSFAWGFAITLVKHEPGDPPERLMYIPWFSFAYTARMPSIPACASARLDHRDRVLIR